MSEVTQEFIDRTHKNMKSFSDIMCLSERLRNIEDAMLNNVDFFGRFQSAPASSKYHCNYEGGLLEHTLNVFDVAYSFAGNLPQCDVPMESIAIASILHDIGKVGNKHAPYYSVGSRGGVSVTKGMLPHELLSVQWAQELGIKLTPEEYNAILFHNGLYTPMGSTIKGREEPLTLIIHWADMWASRVVEVENGREE